MNKKMRGKKMVLTNGLIFEMTRFTITIHPNKFNNKIRKKKDKIICGHILLLYMRLKINILSDLL